MFSFRFSAKHESLIMFKRSIMLGNILSLRFTVYKTWIRLAIWRKGIWSYIVVVSWCSSWLIYLSWKFGTLSVFFLNVIFITALSSKKDMSCNYNFMNDRQKWVNLTSKDILFCLFGEKNKRHLFKTSWAYEFLWSGKC